MTAGARDPGRVRVAGAAVGAISGLVSCMAIAGAVGDPLLGLVVLIALGPVTILGAGILGRYADRALRGDREDPSLRASRSSSSGRATALSAWTPDPPSSAIVPLLLAAVVLGVVASAVLLVVL